MHDLFSFFNSVTQVGMAIMNVIKVLKSSVRSHYCLADMTFRWMKYFLIGRTINIVLNGKTH